MSQQQIINQCKCGGRGLATNAWHCGENMQVYRVECLSCGTETQWPHAERAEAVKEWNKIQGAGHE